MSTIRKICFDASLKDGAVGVGVYDFDKKVEITAKYELAKGKITVLTAETIALIETINYMRREGITKAHLFTDNSCLAEKGVAQKIADEFEHITLTWIPREFNEDADRLSKEANKLEITTLTKNKPNTGAKKKAKNYISHKSIKKNIINSGIVKKVNLLRLFAKTEFAKEILDAMISDTAVNGKYRKADKVFIKILNSITTSHDYASINTIRATIKNHCNSEYTSTELHNILINL